MLVTSFTPDANFWELNPLFTVAGPSKRLYDEDTSKGRIVSSKMMWFVAFCYDLAPENIFSRLPEVEKHELIGKDYMNNERFYEDNKELLDPLIEHYCHLEHTAATRHLYVWNIKMDEKTKYMKETAYAPETWKMLEDMMKSNKEIFASYKQILQELNKEQAGGSAKGGKTPSLSDTGAI